MNRDYPHFHCNNGNQINLLIRKNAFQDNSTCIYFQWSYNYLQPTFKSSVGSCLKRNCLSQEMRREYLQLAENFMISGRNGLRIEIPIQLQNVWLKSIQQKKSVIQLKSKKIQERLYNDQSKCFVPCSGGPSARPPGALSRAHLGAAPAQALCTKKYH